MAEVLAAHAIKWIELPRLEATGLPISATQVRKAFAENDAETLQRLVPPATFRFLQSPPARAIAERLRTEGA
jgi:[citrate (pro-3S)-lyase] ligase